MMQSLKHFENQSLHFKICAKVKHVSSASYRMNASNSKNERSSNFETIKYRWCSKPKYESFVLTQNIYRKWLQTEVKNETPIGMNVTFEMKYSNNNWQVTYVSVATNINRLNIFHFDASVGLIDVYDNVKVNRNKFINKNSSLQQAKIISQMIISFKFLKKNLITIITFI